MPKPEHFFAPGEIESYRAEPTRVDTFCSFLLAVLVLLALALALGHLLGYVEVYEHLLSSIATLK